MSSIGIEFNTGTWTDEEHQGFLRGLEVYGRHWNAIGMLVRSRSPIQIQAHAQQHFAGGESLHLDQVVQHIDAGGAAVSSSASSPASSSSSSPSRSGGGFSGGGSDGGSDGGGSGVHQGVFDGDAGIRSGGFRHNRITWEPAPRLVVNHIPAPHPEELHGDNVGIHDAPALDADVPGGLLPPVVNDGIHGGQHPQASVRHGVWNQAGEPMVGLAPHENNGWEEPALGEAMRRYFRIGDFCGIL